LIKKRRTCRLFFPDSGKEVRYAGVKVRPATRAVRAAHRRIWVGVHVEGAGGARLFSRLRDDGRLEKGIALDALSRHVLSSGWIQGALPRGSIVENIATGKRVKVDVPGKVDPLSAVAGRLEDGSFIAIAPERCVYAASEEFPQLATSEGCFLVPAKPGEELAEGPWTLRCAR
jgi:hypothetical protein